MKRTSLSVALVVLSTLSVGCSNNKTPKAPEAPVSAKTTAIPQTAATPRTVDATPPTAPARPPAGPRLGDGVQWFRSSAEYRAITISTYAAATEAVTNAARSKARDSWAVVLDADETVLDNSVFQRDLSKGVAPFSEELWATFVHQRSSVPVPGAKSFLDRVKELGGRILIVTNRFENLCEDTRENFRLQSLPYDAIACRAISSAPGTNTGDKNARFETAATGAAFGDAKPREVLAFVGDNILDFPAQKQSLRDEPESAFSPFGKRFFILPNPMYGSWQQVPAR